MTTAAKNILKGFKIIWEMGDQKMKSYFIISFSKNGMSKQAYNYEPFN